MPNPYHLLANGNFNTDDSYSIQRALDDLCEMYKDYKYELQSSTEYSDTKYYICVQTMGFWRGPDTTVHDFWDGDGWSWLRPPQETQMAMQFLPLCYGVDGIHDFAFQSFNDDDVVGYWQAININEGSIEASGAYEGLKAANKKIAVYGPLLSSPVTHGQDSPQLTWRDALTLQVSDTPITLYSPDIRSYGVTDLGVESVVILPSGNGFYQGAVHAGFYKDMLSGFSSFMLVNRRANYFNTDPSMRYDNPRYVPPSMLDSFFTPAEPQTVRFYLNQDAHNMVGDNVGLYDPSTKALYTGENNTIDVPIGPGDGILVQMCATLPETVTDDTILAHSVVLQGDIEITNDVEIEILQNTQVTILDNTHFILESGASLNIAGNISIGDSVRFSIASQATVNISEAVCEFQGALLIDGNGSFNVADSTSSTYLENSQSYISEGVIVNLSGVQTYRKNAQVIVTGQSELSYENAELYLGALVRIKTDHSFLNFLHSSISQGANADSIFVNNLSSIYILNSTIKWAPIYVRATNLHMENSTIEVKNNRRGFQFITIHCSERTDNRRSRAK
jgi:hypothetical protein